MRGREDVVSARQNEKMRELHGRMKRGGSAWQDEKLSEVLGRMRRREKCMAD
jgi:FtsZ-binding cell division protein ZapB